MVAFAAAFLLGIVAGLRTFTAPAVLWMIRHTGPVAYGLGAVAILEYLGDLYPGAPARTRASGLVARILSGAFCGWMLATAAGISPALAAVLGAAGAVVGAYGGLAARVRAIALIGAVPAALLEDAVAIAAAVAIVMNSNRLP
jgi:uncharacterized membrane protein